MTPTLREVLNYFEKQSRALSLTDLARELRVEPALLQEMIGYWVRKGKLRQVSADSCGSCGCSAGCPLPTTLPRRYELATGDLPTGVSFCPRCGA